MLRSHRRSDTACISGSLPVAEADVISRHSSAPELSSSLVDGAFTLIRPHAAEPKLSFQHGQRLASALRLEVAAYRLKYHSPHRCPCGFAAQAGLIVRQRAFTQRDVGARRIPGTRVHNTALIDGHATVSPSRKALGHVWVVALSRSVAA